MSSLQNAILTGKSVLVTGGSKGIGLACVTAFAKEGARVFFTYRQDDASVAALADQGITGYRSDATDAEAVAALARDIAEATGGALDVLSGGRLVLGVGTAPPGRAGRPRRTPWSRHAR